MTDRSAPEKKSAFDEIQALKVLYQNIVKIIIITIAFGVIVAGYSLTMRDVYQSSSAIIIKAPEIPVKGEMPPLRVETLKLLVESPTIKMELFEKLKNFDSGLPPEASFRNFSKSLQTWTGVEQGRNKVFLPMVKLSATSKDQQLSATIANAWADLVLEKTKDLYNTDVDELTSFTKTVFNQAQERLNASEDAYTAKLLASQLAVKKEQLKGNKKSHAAIFTEYLNQAKMDNFLQSQLNEAAARLAEQEIDNVWVGELCNRIYRSNETQHNQTTDTSREMAQLLDKIKASTPTLTIQLTVQHTVENERRLAQFEKESKLQYKKMVLLQNENQLGVLYEDIITQQNLLAKSETLTEQLTIELSKLKPTIPLNITLMQTPIIGLEIANPVYQLTKEREINLLADIAGLKARVEYYSTQQAAYQEAVSQLASEIATEEAAREALQRAIDKDKAMFIYMEEEYNSLRQHHEKLKLQHSAALAKIAARKLKVASLEQEINALEKEIFTNEDELAKLKREVESLVKVHNSLAVKAEEVDLLTVSQKGVSRSGAVLLYEALANPNKVAPHRSKIVLLAMLFALIASSALFIAHHLIRDN